MNVKLKVINSDSDARNYSGMKGLTNMEME